MKNNKVTIHFLGAAGTVTGSKFLLDTGDHKLLVDCGLFQGLKKLRLLNWDYLPVDAADIDVVLLTHGHLDHTGYLPKLVNAGYHNSIQGTAPTLDIAKIILRDSANIQEEEAERANREGFSKHHPAKPLYTLKDAERAITQFRPVPEGEWVELFDGIEARFNYNGHIIGSTFIELDIYGERFVFSGDVGRREDVLMHPYKKPKKADVLFVESTYGGRDHPSIDLMQKLQGIIQNTFDKGGTLIIPSFAVERAQILMFFLWQLRKKGDIPSLPFIMDSPMASRVLEVFHTHPDWHKLSRDECTDMCEQFQIVKSFKETWEVIDMDQPKIVIAGSGMVTGGRVLTYLQQYMGLPETTILLAGYQAEGTRGRALLEGAKSLKIYGKYYPLKAEVLNIEVLSAHADQEELLDWMSDIESPPKKTFIVHGENHAADAMRLQIKDTYGWESVLPELYSIEEIDFTSADN